MREKAYVDTSMILSVLLETEKYETAEELLARFHDHGLVTSGIAINEAVYVVTLEYYKQIGLIKGKYGLREVVKQEGFPRKVIESINNFIKDINIIIINDYFNLQEYTEILTRYRLLPNDAQIALTCKHYGIYTILTFDEDFKRVPWLEVIP